MANEMGAKQSPESGGHNYNYGGTYAGYSAVGYGDGGGEGGQQVIDSDIKTAEDLNTQVKIIESTTLVQRVADRIKGDDLRQFLAPYENCLLYTSDAADERSS